MSTGRQANGKQLWKSQIIGYADIGLQARKQRASCKLMQGIKHASK